MARIKTYVSEIGNVNSSCLVRVKQIERCPNVVAKFLRQLIVVGFAGKPIALAAQSERHFSQAPARSSRSATVCQSEAVYTSTRIF